MPKTVLDQEGKFKRDEILKKLSEDNKICYTNIQTNGVVIEEISKQLFTDLEDGFVNIVYVDSGINLRLNIRSLLHETNEIAKNENVTVGDKSISLKSRFILNGVCVIWKGEINLSTLHGTARIEFDSEMAKEESLTFRNQLEDYSALFGLSQELSDRSTPTTTSTDKAEYEPESDLSDN